MFSTGETFRSLVDQYLQTPLRKGVPPLFIVLRPLYSDPEKVKIIEELALGCVHSLKETGYFVKGESSVHGVQSILGRYQILILIIINLIYIAQFNTKGILTALYIVIKYMQMQYMHIWTYMKQSCSYTYTCLHICIQQDTSSL